MSNAPSLPPYLAVLEPDVVDIAVQVVARASRTRVVGPHGDRLKIALAAPPVEGAANAALVDFLADLLGVARRDVELVRGQTSKRKTARVRGLTPASIAGRLVA